MPDVDTLTPSDNFDAAFARLSELDNEPPAVVDQPAAVEPDAPVVDTPAEVTPDAPAAEAPAQAEITEDTPDAPAAAQDQSADDDLIGRLAELVKNAPAKAPEPAPKQAEAPVTEEPPIYTPDEEKFIADYEKDWPDVARAEQLRRKGEYATLVKHVFAEVGKHIFPLMDTVRSLAENTQYAELTTAVPDYDVVREDVISWVEKEPAYLRNAYEHVIRQGTVAEVADLITRYKQANGLTAPAATTTPAPTTTKKTELPQATKQAAASLAPVSSKRSAIVQGRDPNDFDGAFEDFDRKL
jgi:hypothetical protein